MLVNILSLFPGYFESPFKYSILKIAQEKNLLDINLIDVRDFSEDIHRRVDDRPYGGGPGMVMTPQPIVSAIRSVKKKGSYVVYMSPQGKLLNASLCRKLSQKDNLIVLCGHYEGIDQRIVDAEVDEEVSIGDYVLTNGCLSAIVLLDAVVRLIPGVLGHSESSTEDSFENGYLDWPHYTKPQEFEGQKVPPVLLSGNHQEIYKWRKSQALTKTKLVRPDLIPNLKVDI